MEYPITNAYMDLNAERLGKNSAQAQYIREALQTVEKHMNMAVQAVFGVSGDTAPINFELSQTLPRWHLEPSYANTVEVDFDGAEGGAVWLSYAEGSDNAIAVRGPQAARELARMLLAFADEYPAPLEGEKP